jgi:hypothetical protein
MLVDIGSYYAFLPVHTVCETKSAYVLKRSEVVIISQYFLSLLNGGKSSFIHIKYTSSVQIIFMNRLLQDTKKLSFFAEHSEVWP